MKKCCHNCTKFYKYDEKEDYGRCSYDETEYHNANSCPYWSRYETTIIEENYKIQIKVRMTPIIINGWIKKL